MTRDVPAASACGEAAGAAGACDWAGCTRLDTTHADGWWHCTDHLAEHHALTGGLARDEQIRLLNSRGLNDSQISAHLDVHPSTVGYHRRRLGLPKQYGVTV